MWFTFRVEDGAEDGALWGDLRVEADSEGEAREKARRRLDAEEVEPRGSLLPGYTLTLESCNPEAYRRVIPKS